MTPPSARLFASREAKDLRNVMQGKGAIAGEAFYEGARRVFNGAVDRRPALFAFCESARDVQEAVRAARSYGLPLSVRGGGHDWAGRALSHHGLVVDLSRMRQVEVDVRGRVATVAGGALAGDVIAAAGPHGLAAVTGAAGTVGFAGLLTGGGYGPLLPRFGLALDNLVGAEIVLADGQMVFADSSQNSELFWAIRGGLASTFKRGCRVHVCRCTWIVSKNRTASRQRKRGLR